MALKFELPNLIGNAGKVLAIDPTESFVFWKTDASGVTTFTQLTDVPSSYSGKAGLAVYVNATETGLEFKAAVSTDEKVKLSALDPTAGYLNDKITTGTGISYNNGLFTNTAPDQVVAITGGVGINTSGTYPNFTITNSLPDQVVALTAGTNISSITGTYPNFTINAATQPGTYTLPTATDTVLGGIKVGTTLSIVAGVLNYTNPNPTPYTLPTASATVLGGIKVGTNLSIDVNGVLSATGFGAGNVVGPASATDSNFASYDSTTGKLIKDSGYSAASFAPAGSYLTTSTGLKLDQTTPQSVINGAPKFDAIDFSLTPASTPVEGRLSWNSTEETLDLGQKNGVVLQIGQEMNTKVKNNTGSTILNGKAVYMNGRDGMTPTIALARSDSVSTSRVLGLATENITTGSTGKVTTMGLVHDLKTDYSGSGIWGTTWVTNDLLYLSKTDAGVLTNVAPAAPNHADIVGRVGIVDGTTGTIDVGIERHSELSDLSDVNGTALTTSGQILVWNQTAGYHDFNYNINNYELLANKSTDVALGTSNTLYPTQNAVKSYADTADNRFPVDIGRYGFISRNETTIAFNGVKTFTLASVGASWSYYRTGLKYTISGNKTVDLVAGTPVDGTLYYIYIDSTDGSLTCDTGGWNLNDTKVPVSTIYWDSTCTPNYIKADERHTCGVDRKWHREHHYVEGTQTSTPGTVTGLVAGSTTPADKTFGISGTAIFDEDLKFNLASLTDPDGATAVYYILYRVSATRYKWVASDMPFKYSGTTSPFGYIEYDNAGTSTPALNKNWVNTYIFSSNSVAASEANPEISNAVTRYFIMQGRGAYATAALATAEQFLISSGMPVAEGTAIYQLTWDTSGIANTVKGRCTFVSIQQIRANTITTSSITTTAHNGLSGIDGGAPGEYYHFTLAEHTNLANLAGLTYASPSFVKMTGTNTYALDTSTYLTSLSGAVLTSQVSPQTIGDTTNRLAKLWATDITVTNAIVGSVTGNATTVTMVDAAGDTTTFPLLGTSATGNLTPATDSGLTYDATSKILTAGGLALGVGSITMSGSIGVTGTRITKGWFTDITVTNAITGSVTGNAGTVTNGIYTTSDATALAATSAGNKDKYLHSNATTGALEWSIVASAGATTALDNLASVAINAALIPGTAGALDVGSTTKPWASLWFAGTSATPGTNQFKITGASTSGVRTITAPDRSITLDNITTATTTNGTGFLKGNGSVISFDNSTYLTSVGTGVANEITYWSGTNTLGSLATATYPSLTELSYVKGVTSGIQAQINAKGVGDMTLAGVQSVTGAKTFDKDKILMKGTSTGTTTISTANTSATSYTATLQAATGTLAYTTNIPVKATGAEVNTGTDDAKFVTAKAIKDSYLGDIGSSIIMNQVFS